MKTPKRVLIVEDEHDNREILRAVVEEIVGYEALIARDGAEGLILAADRRPDLILLDLMMPGLNGFEVVRRLKGNAATRAVPVVAISALTRTRDRDEAIAAGADSYVDKPFDLFELAETIRRLAGDGLNPAAPRNGVAPS